MARSRIGFIVGPGGNPTGIGDFVNDHDMANIPATIMANDTTTGLSDIMALDTNVPHFMQFRVVVDGTEQYAVPDYTLTPEAAAQKHWNLIKPLFPPEVVSNRDRIWIQPINEVDKNRADWLGNFAVELATIANAQGYKVLMFGWASGEPNSEHWHEPGMVSYLQYCDSNHDVAGIALHEYDYGHVGMAETYPFHIGRFTELFSVCDDLGVKRPIVGITEFGWSYTNIPPLPQVMADVDFAARLYGRYPEILGVGIWYLGPGFSNIANKVNGLLGPVGEYNINTTLPDPEPGDNVLINGSFELGWYNWDGVQELQVPNDWELWFADETVENPYDSNPWSVFRQPETRVLPKSQLPQDEQNVFVLDGYYCVKAFKGYGSIHYSLGQWIQPGKWKLTINVYPDLIVGYNSDGTKIFSDDPNACIVWAEINGTLKSEELRPIPGKYNELYFELELGSTSFVEVFFMQPFAIVNNGCFFDNWRLEDMSDNCSAREPYNREFWVPDPGMSKEDYLALCSLAYDDDRKTVGFSYDDAGIGCGLSGKTAVLFNIQDNDKQIFIDWYSQHYSGTQVEFRDFPVAPSTD